MAILKKISLQMEILYEHEDVLAALSVLTFLREK